MQPPVPNGDPGQRGAFVVRAGTNGDLQRVVELLTLGALPGSAPGVEDPADLVPYQLALAASGHAGGGVLVAEIDGEVLGVCQLIVFRHLQSRGGLCAEIESVHVHPEHRGMGVGTALLRAAISRARDLGCYRVQLTSNLRRPDAHRLYERLGFTPSHTGFKMLLL
ncbi:MAG TPA: GNAT family N-acetyltransferase [Acidimicrobiales bacterium]|nr:GNAT family N-acetyltransferase [Acidimicrobiales bacterium]